jgi:hypothetical protein
MTRSARPAAPPRKGGFAAAGARPGRKPRTAPVPTETQVHLQVASYFKKVGLGGCALAFHIRNERPGRWEKIQAHRMGILPGVCDWVILDGGQAGFTELKPAGWKDSKRRSSKYTAHELRQGEAQELLRRAGCWVDICETLPEVIASLRYHGVPLKADLKEPALITALRRSMSEAE